MQSLEIVTYFSVAIIVAGLLLYASLTVIPSQQLMTQEELSFSQVTSNELPLVAAALWESCSLGLEEGNHTLVLTQGIVTEESFFRVIEQHNLCSQLQSISNGCGSREDVNLSITDDARPVVLLLSCDPQVRQLKIR